MIVLFSNLPTVSLLLNGVQEYKNFSFYYNIQLISFFITIFIATIDKFNNKNNKFSYKVCDKTYIVHVFIFSLIITIATSVMFTRNNPDYFWMMHKGEVVMPDYIYIMCKITFFYAIYNLLFKKLSKTDLILCLLMLFLQNIYWFILGFRSPFLTCFLVIICIFFYSKIKYQSDKYINRSKKLFVLGIFIILLFVFDFLTQIRYFDSYTYRLPIIPFLLEVHVGTSAGKVILEQAIESTNSFEFLKSNNTFNPLCIIFSPFSYSQFIPRGLSINISELFGTVPSNCVTYSFTFNEEISATLREGEGVASNFLADLWGVIGWLSVPIYYAIFIIGFYLDRLLKMSETRRKFQFISVICCLYIPSLLIIWRAGLFHFPILDLVLFICIYVLINNSKKIYKN